MLNTLHYVFRVNKAIEFNSYKQLQLLIVCCMQELLIRGITLNKDASRDPPLHVPYKTRFRDTVPDL